MNMKKGFTLIEIMTSVALFAVVMTISMGSIISVMSANRKAESLKSVIDNLNLAVESMSRELRFGTNYNDGQPCSNGCESLAFLANDGITRIEYRKTGSTIEKSVGGQPFVPLTAPEIEIQEMKFYAIGINQNDNKQPWVLIKIRGTAGTKASEKTDFMIQTTVSQRQLDS